MLFDTFIAQSVIIDHNLLVSIKVILLLMLIFFFIFFNLADDQVLLIGAGITLHEALKAADQLAQQGINCRVLDPFTIKPIDATGISENAKACKGRIVVVEDHYPEGGLGEAVSGALSGETGITIKHLAVREVPRSGPPDALIEKYGIGANSIIAAVKSFA